MKSNHKIHFLLIISVAVFIFFIPATIAVEQAYSGNDAPLSDPTSLILLSMFILFVIGVFLFRHHQVKESINYIINMQHKQKVRDLEKPVLIFSVLNLIVMFALIGAAVAIFFLDTSLFFSNAIVIVVLVMMVLIMFFSSFLGLKQIKNKPKIELKHYISLSTSILVIIFALYTVVTNYPLYNLIYLGGSDIVTQLTTYLWTVLAVILALNLFISLKLSLTFRNINRSQIQEEKVEKNQFIINKIKTTGIVFIFITIIAIPAYILFIGIRSSIPINIILMIIPIFLIIKGVSTIQSNPEENNKIYFQLILVIQFIFFIFSLVVGYYTLIFFSSIFLMFNLILITRMILLQHKLIKGEQIQEPSTSQTPPSTQQSHGLLNLLNRGDATSQAEQSAPQSVNSSSIQSTASQFSTKATDFISNLQLLNTKKELRAIYLIILSIVIGIVSAFIYTESRGLVQEGLYIIEYIYVIWWGIIGWTISTVFYTAGCYLLSKEWKQVSNKSKAIKEINNFSKSFLLVQILTMIVAIIVNSIYGFGPWGGVFLPLIAILDAYKYRKRILSSIRMNYGGTQPQSPPTTNNVQSTSTSHPFRVQSSQTPITTQTIENELEDVSLTCPFCDIEIEEDYKFCPSCHKSLEEVDQFCPYCGRKTKREWEICAYCGKEI